MKPFTEAPSEADATLRYEHAYNAYLRHRDRRRPAMSFEAWLRTQKEVAEAALAVADYETYREDCGAHGRTPVAFAVFHPIWQRARREQLPVETVAFTLRRAEAAQPR